MQELITKEITLPQPIVVNEKTITTVTMREALVSDHLEAADMAGPNASNARYEACLLSHLISIPFAVFIKMPEANLFALNKEYYAMGKPTPTPKNSDAPVSSSANTQDND